jgi:hypothetical protein
VDVAARYFEEQDNKDGSSGDRRSHRLGVLRLRI